MVSYSGVLRAYYRLLEILDIVNRPDILTSTLARVSVSLGTLQPKSLCPLARNKSDLYQNEPFWAAVAPLVNW